MPYSVGESNKQGSELSLIKSLWSNYCNSCKNVHLCTNKYIYWEDDVLYGDVESFQRVTLLEFNKRHAKMTYIYNYRSSDVQMVFTGTLKMGHSHAHKK